MPRTESKWMTRPQSHVKLAVTDAKPPANLLETRTVTTSFTFPTRYRTVALITAATCVVLLNPCTRLQGQTAKEQSKAEPAKERAKTQAKAKAKAKAAPRTVCRRRSPTYLMASTSVRCWTSSRPTPRSPPRSSSTSTAAAGSTATRWAWETSRSCSTAESRSRRSTIASPRRPRRPGPSRR